MVRPCKALLALALWCACALPASAGPYSALYVFGDSLSDVGNTSAATLGIEPGGGYFQGRFSNGPVYAERIAAGLGLGTLTRSGAGGTNYAFGGAETNGPGGFSGLFVDSLVEQIDDYLPASPASDALFVAFIGANDLLNGQTNVATPLGVIQTQLQRLVDAGARNLLGINLPPLGLTPSNLGNTALTNLSSAFNDGLSGVYDALESATPELNLMRLDASELFFELVDDPAAFGFTNTTQQGIAVAGGTLEAPGYLFWDGVHPTRKTHELLALVALRAVLPAGDFTRDGVVDANDYAEWSTGFGSTFDASQGGVLGNLAADANGDGRVDAADYTVWRDAVGSLPVSVPEPTGAVLIALLLVCSSRSASRRSA